jgi:uncharacterized protein (TIGR02231 family)
MRQKVTAAVIILLASIGLTQPARAEIEDADAPIRQVTVYPDRAKITRIVDLELPIGEYEILIKGLPMGVIDASLRGSARGVEGITFLGLSHRNEQHLSTPREDVARLEERIYKLEHEDKQALVDRLEAFRQQKELLTSLGGQAVVVMNTQIKDASMNVDQWQAAYEFVGARLVAANDSIRAASLAQNKIDQQLEMLRKQLSALKAGTSQTSKTVQIDLRLARSGPVRVELEYIIPGATWWPVYDARLADLSGPVTLTYFASVTQQTGEDWQDVKLTLSTAQPSLGTGPGALSAWYLNVRKFLRVEELDKAPASIRTTPEGEVFIQGGRAGEVRYITDGVPLGDPLGSLGQSGANLSLVSGSMISNTGFNTVFEVERRENIPSSDKAVRTRIAEFELEQETRFICRPRLREGVYRLVKITNQEEAPLMPGPVAIFSGADFIGNSALSSLVAPGEEFELPFGLFNGIKVTRQLLGYKRSETGGFMSSDKLRIEQTVEITLSNNGSGKHAVVLEDVVPVSQDERIKVSMDGTRPEPDSIDVKGIARWTIHLEPDGKQIVRVPYRVEYPADMEIVGL